MHVDVCVPTSKCICDLNPMVAMPLPHPRQSTYPWL